MTDRLFDPKGLIREAYRIEGIDASQCRSIFLDWALSVPLGEDSRVLVKALHAHYGAENPEHPMTLVLAEGMAEGQRARRRGGWRSRERPAADKGA